MSASDGFASQGTITPDASVPCYRAKLSYVEPASYWIAHLTVCFALIEIAKPACGQTVVITAASSPTGERNFCTHFVRLARFIVHTAHKEHVPC
jgi:NADPH:quinone reductase-like Zn-dependent oxidoreductase